MPTILLPAAPDPPLDVPAALISRRRIPIPPLIDLARFSGRADALLHGGSGGGRARARRRMLDVSSAYATVARPRRPAAA